MIFIETSVLIAAWQENHTHHGQSFDLVQALSPTTACTSTHCIVDAVSGMTRMPHLFAVSPSEAMRIVDQTRTLLTIVPLGLSSDLEALNEFAGRHVGGHGLRCDDSRMCSQHQGAEGLYLEQEAL